MLTVMAKIEDGVLSPYLEKRAVLHQGVVRKLFVAIYFKHEDPNLAYSRLAKQHGIFDSEINSMRKETEAIFSGWEELLAERIEKQEGKIAKLEAKLGKKVSSGKAHQWRRKLHRYRLKLVAMRAELASVAGGLRVVRKSRFKTPRWFSDLNAKGRWGFSTGLES